MHAHVQVRTDNGARALAGQSPAGGGLGSRPHQPTSQVPVTVQKTLLLYEPLPSKAAAEVPIQPLIWCFTAAFPRGLRLVCPMRPSGAARVQEDVRGAVRTLPDASVDCRTGGVGTVCRPRCAVLLDLGGCGCVVSPYTRHKGTHDGESWVNRFGQHTLSLGSAV